MVILTVCTNMGHTKLQDSEGYQEKDEICSHPNIGLASVSAALWLVANRVRFSSVDIISILRESVQ